ncbi:hypothetical protein [Serratia fonticola]|uniref:hypothetical protein n=1 Tax=Serratia fonticola TaxID=47917 RepID=UPI002DB63EE1|nr:hypothetical protein [Serratia fonticola]MEB7885485.1 hypothetical protein [Serratia fonticola]
MMMRYLFPLVVTLIVMPLQARPLNDYHAVYHILPLQGETPIGEYRVAQRWDAQRHLYVQQASITFSWQVLLSTHHYRYQDEVDYGANGNLSYRLHEDNDGKIRMVMGVLPAQSTTLTLHIDDNQGTTQKTIAKSQFDYTLFALRFPTPCGPHLTGKQRRVRSLFPISGDIDSSLIRYLGMTDLHLPGVAGSFNDLCLIETTGNGKERNRLSWVNRDGYLVYETSASYRLLLVPLASHLSPNHQEKP